MKYNFFFFLKDSFLEIMRNNEDNYEVELIFSLEIGRKKKDSSNLFSSIKSTKYNLHK